MHQTQHHVTYTRGAVVCLAIIIMLFGPSNGAENMDCDPLPKEVQTILGRGVNIVRNPLKWQEGLKPIFVVEPRRIMRDPDDPYFEPPTRASQCFKVLRSEIYGDRTSSADGNQQSDQQQQQNNFVWYHQPQGFQIRPQWNQNRSEKTDEQTRFDFATKTRPSQLESLPPLFSRLYARRDPLLTGAFGDKLQARNYVSHARYLDQKYHVRTDLSGGQFSAAPAVDDELLNMLKRIASSGQEPSASDYELLFSTYGTHYIAEGALGGSHEIIYLINEKCANDSSNTTHPDTDFTKIKKHEIQLGGDPRFTQYVGDCIGQNLEQLPPATCNRYVQDWRRSLYTKPALVLQTLKLRELSELAEAHGGFAPDYMTTLRRRIKSGLEQYIAQKNGEPPRPQDGSSVAVIPCMGEQQCQNGGQMLPFVSDNTGKVACQCVCRKGWHGRSCERNLCTDPLSDEDDERRMNKGGAVGASGVGTEQKGRGTILECYQCNVKDNGTICDDANIHTDEARQFVVKCNAQQMQDAVKERLNTDQEPFDPARVRCRKNIQTVQGEQILYRECAYVLPHEAEKGDTYCAYRSGSAEVNYKVCYCNTDWCNAAVRSHASTNLSFAFAAVILAALMSPGNLQR